MSLTTYVLDASVAVAWYLPESFSPRARHFHRRMLKGNDRFVVPDLHFLEFANALRTYARRGVLDQDDANEIYQLHLAAPLDVVHVENATLLEIAFEYESTTYDATYIALVLTQEATLITAERTTTPWVVKLAEKVQIVSS